ncbi:MAG: hypothetical protein HRU09_07395 [Oligoflexales bacterium]|nr:hypothetical protein [Oligoflexales bacterium]
MRSPLLTAMLIFLFAESAHAGLLFSVSAHWGVFAFRPLSEQDSSPNYYGLGPSLVAGYSLFQVFDAAAYIDYIPGQRGAPNIERETASLTQYGLQLALRLEDKIYLGFKAGQGVYHLIKKDFIDDEVEGLWQGPSGGLMLGAIHKEDKRNYWQLTLEFIHVVAGKIRRQGEPEPGDRKIDCFKVSLSYTYNDFVNHMMRRSIFKNIF